MGLDKFHTSDWNEIDLCLRILCAVLLQRELNSELSNCTKLTSYLIRMKVTVQNMRSRYVNLMLCFMQITTPILTQISFVIATAQEPSLKMIIKGYATIKLATNLDNLFATTFPKSVHDEVCRINDDKEEMLMPKDNANTT